MKKFKQILIQSLVFISLANIGFAKSESLTFVNKTNMWTNDQQMRICSKIQRIIYNNMLKITGKSRQIYPK